MHNKIIIITAEKYFAFLMSVNFISPELILRENSNGKRFRLSPALCQVVFIKFLTKKSYFIIFILYFTALSGKVLIIIIIVHTCQLIYFRHS